MFVTNANLTNLNFLHDFKFSSDTRPFSAKQQKLRARPCPSGAPSIPSQGRTEAVSSLPVSIPLHEESSCYRQPDQKDDHKKVDIVPGDTVIISATPIPGNEKLVSRTIDHLYKLGADVIYEKSNGVHVSGHACQDDIYMMHNLVRPKFFIPVHGEYRHLIKHAQLAGSLGMPRENIVVGENGSIIELTRNSIGINGRVPSGKVLVDGLGVGDVGNIVLRDRRQLSQDGIMIVVVTIDKDTCTVVSGPDIVSRGFVYVREAEGLMETAKEKVQQALDKCEQSNVSEWSVIKSAVRDSLGRFLYEKTRRRPMILPIIMEI